LAQWTESADMKISIAGIALALAFAATTVPADAKGCIKGAIVGGVAGHYAGRHGFLGAAAGCLVGRHMAKQHQRAVHAQKPTQSPSPDQSY
jgi:hypothetical protein